MRENTKSNPKEEITAYRVQEAFDFSGEDTYLYQASLDALTTIASGFLVQNNWHRGLPGLVGQLGKGLRVSRVMVSQNCTSSSGITAEVLALWEDLDHCSPSDERMDAKIFEFSPNFERWQNLLNKNLAVRGHTRLMPIQEQALLKQGGVGSVMVVPIFQGEVWWGWLRLDLCFEERVFSNAEEQCLRICACLIGAAVQRECAIQELNQRLALEELAERISSRLIRVTTEFAELEILNALQMVGDFLAVDGIFLSLMPLHNEETLLSYRWDLEHPAGVVEKVNVRLAIQRFQWGLDRLLRGEIVELSDINLLPETARLEKEFLRREGSRSFLVLPLVNDQKVTAFLRLCMRREVRHWKPEDVRLLQLLADSFQNLLVRLSREDEIRRRDGLLNVLNQSVEKFLQLSNWETVIQGVLEDWGKAANASRVYIFQNYEEDGHSLSTRGRYDWTAPGIQSRLNTPLFQYFNYQSEGFGRWRYLLEHNQIICGSVNDFLEYERSFLTAHHIVSLVLIPIFIEKTWWGFLGFDRRTNERNWLPEEIEILKTAAEMLGLAIDRTGYETRLMTINRQLESSVDRLERSNEEGRLLNEMGSLLQSCLRMEEAFRVIGQFIGLLFAGTNGIFYRYEAAHNLLQSDTTWGKPVSELVFLPEACWGLRRGRLYAAGEQRLGIPCQHVHKEQFPYLCVPIMAQGELFGLLHVESESMEDANFISRWEQLAMTVSERLGTTLANLKLSNILRVQSTRDALTNLFNRRYLEDTLERELSRATRRKHPVTVVMMDIDHFKGYNDSYGHDAGDMLLREVGRYLLENIRGEDAVCRYGGDELTLIFPGASLEDSMRRADKLREGIKKLQLIYQDRPLGTITISLGLACFPQHGSTPADLVRMADMALLRAKSEGRDRVMLAFANN